jgi:hypothetical protein
MKMYYCGSTMCNYEAIDVVIYNLNANIHVYVHEDLNEIYLYNVKKAKLCPLNDPCSDIW